MKRFILICFHLLFFITPIILTPWNYELFEYNKMMITYLFTVCIVAAWAIHSIREGTVEIRRTPLDIPIALFLTALGISTLLSIDRHVSLWGYYSRFNGGLVSIVSYVVLYYAFVTNIPREKMKGLFLTILTSATITSLWAFLEHYGRSFSCLILMGEFNVNCWVQDVQNRVFSTLGQPNWLAAYLNVILLIIAGVTDQIWQQRKKALAAGILFLLVYLALIYTKSRSGFLGFTGGWIMLWLLLFLQYKNRILKWFLLANASLLIIHFIAGTSFSQLNRFTLPELMKSQNPSPVTQDQPRRPDGNSALIDIGITESGDIRRIVWKGAIDIARHNPFFGSGVETFAFAYYKFRPAEHNMTSEWDFLYNKAHNEFLNYAATTGFIGLTTYLLFIGGFIVWFIKNIHTKSQQRTTNHESRILYISLFSAWLTISITNFFGFSVVLVQLFFYLIPAMLFVLMQGSGSSVIKKWHHSSLMKNIGTGIIVLFFFYGLISVVRLWVADAVFAVGYRASHGDELTQAYPNLRQAIILNSSEPFYYDEFSIVTAQLAAALDEAGDSTTAAQLKEEAINASDEAVRGGRHNVNYWKTRTRVFYALYPLDEKYLIDAAKGLEVARDLSPTDPKIGYNLALIYDKMGRTQEALKEMQRAAALKADYRDAYFALSLFYERDKDAEKAKEALNHILTRINPDDADAKKKLEELNK